MIPGWETRKLGDVCSLLNRGLSPKYVDEGGIVVLNQRCIRDHCVNFDEARRHNVKAKAVHPDRLLQAGDVLVNSTGTGTLGRVGQLRSTPPEPTTVDSHVTIVRPRPGVFFAEFFGYMLRDIEDALKGSGEGCGGQTELSRAVLAEKFSVRFPKSIREQKRIVGILDDAFAGIAIAKANAEKNVQNARAIFESHLETAFTVRDRESVETTLGDLCDFENGDRGKNYPNRKEYVASGIPWINTGHIRPDGTLCKSEMNYITRTKFDSLRGGKIRSGDLVYCLRGATLGKTAFVEPFMEGAVASSLVIIRPRSALNQRFLYYFLTSSIGRGLIKLYSNGAAQPNLGAQSVAKYRIILPTLDRQLAMIKVLDLIVVETARLASVYERKVAALNTLRKSLLRCAFAGELMTKTLGSIEAVA